MTTDPGATWQAEFDAWLAPFLARLRRKEQRRWAPVYLRGRIGPGERKSVGPLAARVAPGAVQQLHHFVAASPWATAPLDEELVRAADRLVGGPDAVLVIDDTALVKQGKHSVGVARQYCGQLGKRANCQVLVSLTLARGEVPVPIGLRLFLPSAWADDPERCARAGVPEACRGARAKADLALAEIDRVVSAGARFGWVLADAGYGTSAAFRQGLSARGLLWAAGIPKVQNVYPPAVELPWPAARTGRPRRQPVPSVAPVAAEAMLARADWRRISWRRGTKGPLAAEFAAVRVRLAEGEQLRNGWHLPGEEVWLIGAHRATGARKYYVSNLPAEVPLERLAALIKARWVCEQAHQQMKEELGLDHFEGRSWLGLHHHALMTLIAFAFLQHLRLGGKRRQRDGRGRTTAPAIAAGGAAPPGCRAHARPRTRPALPAALRSPPAAVIMAE